MKIITGKAKVDNARPKMKKQGAEVLITGVFAVQIVQLAPLGGGQRGQINKNKNQG